jgi:hypothetical protein
MANFCGAPAAKTSQNSQKFSEALICMRQRNNFVEHARFSAPQMIFLPIRVFLLANQANGIT